MPVGDPRHEELLNLCKCARVLEPRIQLPEGGRAIDDGQQLAAGAQWHSRGVAVRDILAVGSWQGPLPRRHLLGQEQERERESRESNTLANR
jgi:hypothetical protein